MAQLVALRQSGVNPTVEENSEDEDGDAAGDDNPVPNRSVMRIHGVSPEFVRRVQASRGSVSIDRLVEMRIHGQEK